MTNLDGVFRREWGPAVAGSVIKYPYEPRRAEQLMSEGGFTKGADGFFSSPIEGRFKSELKTAESPDWVKEMTIMAADWRKVGFEVQDSVLPAALSLKAPRMRFRCGLNVNAVTLLRTLSAIAAASLSHLSKRSWK